MKRKFRMLMSFLSRIKKDEITVQWTAPDGGIEYQWGHSTPELPKNIFDAICEVVETKEDEIFQMDCYSETDYYNIIATIYPKEKKIVITMQAEDYTSEAETYETTLSDPELKDYFTRTGTEIIEARYSGSGDSGDIDHITIDGVDSNIQWGSREPDSQLIWNTLYDRLENAYGGWEIDDGSAGTIELNKNMEIVISHEWNMRVWEDCDGIIEIKEEDLEE